MKMGDIFKCHPFNNNGGKMRKKRQEITEKIHSGYKEILYPDKPLPIPEHRIVAEQKMGRPLRKNEIVHHMDENKLNNSPENLIVFRSISDHVRYHATGNLLKMEDGTYTSPVSEYIFKCKYCQQEFVSTSKKAKYCSTECKNFDARKIARPVKQDLKKMILTMNINQIGKKYNVSGNAIRKWCKSYNLPYKKQEIQELKKKSFINNNRVCVVNDYTNLPITMYSMKKTNGIRRKVEKKVVFNNIYIAIEYLQKYKMTECLDSDAVKRQIVKVLRGERYTYCDCRWESLEWEQLYRKHKAERSAKCQNKDKS